MEQENADHLLMAALRLQLAEVTAQRDAAVAVVLKVSAQRDAALDAGEHLMREITRLAAALHAPVNDSETIQ